MFVCHSSSSGGMGQLVPLNNQRPSLVTKLTRVNMHVNRPIGSLCIFSTRPLRCVQRRQKRHQLSDFMASVIWTWCCFVTPISLFCIIFASLFPFWPVKQTFSATAPRFVTDLLCYLVSQVTSVAAHTADSLRWNVTMESN